MSRRPKLDYLFLIPQELQEIHEAMQQYANWAREKMVYRTCFSLEGRYRAPRWEGDPIPGVQMPTPEAMKIHRAIIKLPITHRSVLFCQYQADDHNFAYKHCLRHGIKRAEIFHKFQIEGLNMLKNSFRNILTLTKNP